MLTSIIFIIEIVNCTVCGVIGAIKAPVTDFLFAVPVSDSTLRQKLIGGTVAEWLG